MKLRSISAFSFVSLFVLAACGKTPGEQVRPHDPTFEGARGGAAAKCLEVDKEATPLLVDWNPEERGDLEAAMKTGVAVFHYDCKTVKLLPDCKVEGDYSFLGITKKEQIISLENADQVQANLPLHGASISGSMDRGSSLDIGLIMVGKSTTGIEGVAKSKLGSRCDGATHYVQSATLGAFAMATKASGDAKAKVAADFIGASASGQSSSKKGVVNKEGEVDACKSADVDAAKAPNGCGAPVRIRLLAITDDGKAEVSKSELACPKGLVAVAGKCGQKTDDAPYECEEKDSAAICETQCQKGNADSCWNLGVRYERGEGVAKDEKKLVEYAKKACDLNMWAACDWYSQTLPYPEARALMLKACDAGFVWSCSTLGSLWAKGNDADNRKAVRAEMRACDGGEVVACLYGARLYMDGGKGLTADPEKALKLFTNLCEDKALYAPTRDTACALGAKLLQPKDPAKAKKWAEQACKNEDVYKDDREIACKIAKKKK